MTGERMRERESEGGVGGKGEGERMCTMCCSHQGMSLLDSTLVLYRNSL